MGDVVHALPLAPTWPRHCRGSRSTGWSRKVSRRSRDESARSPRAAGGTQRWRTTLLSAHLARILGRPAAPSGQRARLGAGCPRPAAKHLDRALSSSASGRARIGRARALGKRAGTRAPSTSRAAAYETNDVVGSARAAFPYRHRDAPRSTCRPRAGAQRNIPRAARAPASTQAARGAVAEGTIARTQALADDRARSRPSPLGESRRSRARRTPARADDAARFRLMPRAQLGMPIAHGPADGAAIIVRLKFQAPTHVAAAAASSNDRASSVTTIRGLVQLVGAQPLPSLRRLPECANHEGRPIDAEQSRTRTPVVVPARPHLHAAHVRLAIPFFTLSVL